MHTNTITCAGLGTQVRVGAREASVGPAAGRDSDTYRCQYAGLYVVRGTSGRTPVVRGPLEYFSVETIGIELWGCIMLAVLTVGARSMIQVSRAERQCTDGLNEHAVRCVHSNLTQWKRAGLIFAWNPEVPRSKLGVAM